MFFSGGDPWHFSLGFDMDADFCVWVLEVDGLRVPPFDAHSDGDGELRARGLDETGWRAWTARVVAARDETVALHLRVRAENRGRRRFPLPRRASPEPRPLPSDVVASFQALRPAAVWSGNPEVGALLADLWGRYRSVSNDRRRDARDVEAGHHADGGRDVWEALAPYRRRLPPPRFAFVGYPTPVDYPVPPKTVLLGTRGWRSDVSAITPRLVGAADLLAKSADGYPRPA